MLSVIDCVQGWRGKMKHAIGKMKLDSRVSKVVEGLSDLYEAFARLTRIATGNECTVGATVGSLRENKWQFQCRNSPGNHSEGPSPSGSENVQIGGFKTGNLVGVVSVKGSCAAEGSFVGFPR